MAQLNTYVHINNDEGSFVYGPDDQLPDEVVEKLVADGNPRIWAVAPEKPAEKPAEEKSEYDSKTVEELKAIAQERDVDLDGKTKKAQIIEALQEADKAATPPPAAQ